MVNEAREALRAFVDGRDFSNDHYRIEVVGTDYCLWRTRGTNPSTDIVIFYERGMGLNLYRASSCAHHAERRCAIDALRKYIDDPPDEDVDEAYKQWGGPLTWLALKAALTTGGNDAP